MAAWKILPAVAAGNVKRVHLELGGKAPFVVFDDADVEAAQDSEIVQDEVFGPVLVALPFDTDDEAIELANDTLRTGILGVDDERVPRPARHP